MRPFRDGETVVVEPWRAVAFSLVKGLVADRSASDRVAAGGYGSAPTGSAPDAHATPAPEANADRSSTAAACTGRGTACPDGSALPDGSAFPNGPGPLFRGAKVTRLGELRQGRSERAEGCGGRTDTGACTVSCSTEIPLEVIAQLHRDCPTATTGSRRTR